MSRCVVWCVWCGCPCLCYWCVVVCAEVLVCTCYVVVWYVYVWWFLSVVCGAMLLLCCVCGDVPWWLVTAACGMRRCLIVTGVYGIIDGVCMM